MCTLPRKRHEVATVLALVVAGAALGCRSGYSGSASGNDVESWDGFGVSAFAFPQVEATQGRRLVVGAPRVWRRGVQAVGAVYEVLTHTGHVRPVLYGDEREENCGSSVCVLTDLTGDGIPEVAVGCPGASRDGRAACGKILVVSGSDFSPISELWGDRAYERLGESIATGYVDGPSGDSIVLVVRHRGGGQPLSVEARSADLVRKRWTAEGEDPTDGFGRSMIVVPDLNRDGVPEVVIGSFWAAREGSRVGKVDVVSGNDGKRLHEYWGTVEGEMFGASLCSLAAVGSGDVIYLAVGSPSYRRDGMRVGRVQIIGVPSGCLRREFVGAVVGGHFGRAVAWYGDPNGDGDDMGVVLVASSSAPSAAVGDGGRVEGFAVGSGARVRDVQGRKARGDLGAFLWADQGARGLKGGAVLIGAPGCFWVPSWRYMRSESFLCMLDFPLSSAVCRVFTAQGRQDVEATGGFLHVAVGSKAER